MTLSNVLSHGFARQYEALGWSVIPIKEASKIPERPWQEFQSRRMTEEEIDSTRWHNVGIVTGSISGICVIDDDLTQSPDFTERLPKTLTAATGKGRHYYFRIPEGKSVPSGTRFLPGIDVRGEGGYVLAPPSIHPNGSVYVWENGWNNLTTNEIGTPNVEIAVLPDFALDAILERNKPSWKESVNGVGEGKRNEAAASYIGKLLRSAAPETYETLWEGAKAWNRKNDPPLEEAELRTVFDSIAKRQSRKTPEKIERLPAVEFDGTGTALLAATIETHPHIIEGFLPPGLAILFGKPKEGKSRLALQIALSVSQGLPPFNSLVMGANNLSGKTMRGHVLYIALEDSASRIQDRLRSLIGSRSAEYLQNIRFCTSFPALFNGGASRLVSLLDEDPDLRLVIIDTLSAFTLGSQESRENAFVAEYRMLKPLHDAISGRPAALLLVHHARKDQHHSHDPFDSTVGTLGVNAVADTLMILQRYRHRGETPQTILTGKGRDIDGYELPLKGRGLLWTIGKEKENDT